MTGSKVNDDFDAAYFEARRSLNGFRVSGLVSSGVYGRMLSRLKEMQKAHNKMIKELDAPEAYWIKEKASKFTVVCSGCDYESIIWNARYCPHCGARMEDKHYEK